jgi:hypothetical protein
MAKVHNTGNHMLESFFATRQSYYHVAFHAATWRYRILRLGTGDKVIFSSKHPVSIVDIKLCYRFQ